MAKVSIILPTYNRALFLPQVFAAVRAQTFADWELIVVDDGSTDDTAEVVAAFQNQVTQPIHYFRQTNQGPPAARNAGLDRTTSPYIAFHDSDDSWLPHHLADTVRALETHPEVDLVFGAMRRVEHASQRVIEESTFHTGGRPIPLLRLQHRVDGALRILEDPRLLETVLFHGGVGTLQTTVFRSRVFESIRLRSYRVCDDRYLGFEVLARGFRPAYFDDVHVVYQVHNNHISAPGGTGSLDKKIAIMENILTCYEDARRLLPLNGREQRSLRQRLLHEYFWHLGYTLLWSHGREREALGAFRTGLRHWPWSLRCWKTYLLSAARVRLHRGIAAKPRLNG